MTPAHPPFLRIAPERCSGCGRCVAACALRLFSLEPRGRRKLAELTAPELCRRCERCLENCPTGALLADTAARPSGPPEERL